LKDDKRRAAMIASAALANSIASSTVMFEIAAGFWMVLYFSLGIGAILSLFRLIVNWAKCRMTTENLRL
jgi:hypothetical protein